MMVKKRTGSADYFLFYLIGVGQYIIAFGMKSIELETAPLQSGLALKNPPKKTHPKKPKKKPPKKTH
jgi:hypothetical protein